MDILLITTAVSFIGAFMPIILKLMLALLCTESKQESVLQSEAAVIRREMSNISMVDEFAKHARLQRKLNKVQDELRSRANARMSSNVRLKMIITYLAQVLVGLVMLGLVWNYKHVPVIVLPEKWLHPISCLLSWPTGVAGGVSITAWILIAGTVARLAMATLTSSIYA